MRRKMPFSAGFGLEVNTVQSSGYIKNLGDKSTLSTIKPVVCGYGMKITGLEQQTEGTVGRAGDSTRSVRDTPAEEPLVGQSRAGLGRAGTRAFWHSCLCPSAVSALSRSLATVLLQSQAQGLTSPAWKFRGLQPGICTTWGVLRETDISRAWLIWHFRHLL